MVRSPRFARIAALLALALSACIPSEGVDEGGRTPTPARGTRAGGTVRVAITPPDGIDPGNANEPSGELLARTMCDQLVMLDPETGEPRPGLAESWSIVPGGQKLFVKLRAGIRFTNGREVTAEDVVFTLDRVASETYASRSASLLEKVNGYAFVHGDAEAPNERARRELIGVQTSDARTVEITLAEPDADFYRVLAHPALSPVAREAVEVDPMAFARDPVCAGPYVLDQPWRPGEPVPLRRSPSYAGMLPMFTRGGAGWADRIEFVVTDDPAAAFARGEVDLARDMRASPGPGVEQRAGARLELLGLPTGVAPFDARAVRIALSMALDREALAAASPFARAPARGFVPPTVPDMHREAACGLNVPLSADVTRARKLLADAGVTSLRFDLTFNDELENRALAEAIAAQWRAGLGARVTLRPLTFEQLLQEGQSTRGPASPFRFGWEPPVATADASLTPLFSVDAIGQNNLARFESGAFADAIRDARKAADDGDRIDASGRAEDLVCSEMPMIPLSFDVETWRVSERVGPAVGVWLGRGDAQPVLREVTAA